MIHQSAPMYSIGMAKSKDPILLAKDFFDQFLSKPIPPLLLPKR